MDMDYHRQTVEVLIDRESGLYKKLAARAARDNVSVESVVDMLMTLGSYHDLERKLDQMNRMEGRK